MVSWLEATFWPKVVSCAFVLSRGLAGLRSTVSCRRNQGGSDNGSLLFGGQAAGVTDFIWVWLLALASPSAEDPSQIDGIGRGMNPKLLASTPQDRCRPAEGKCKRRGDSSWPVWGRRHACKTTTDNFRPKPDKALDYTRTLHNYYAQKPVSQS